MNDSPENHSLQEAHDARCVSLFSLVAAILVFSTAVRGQTKSSFPATSATCPVQFERFNPLGPSVRIRNTSGKKIVGLVFNAALADATEQWKWYHWDFDDTRPIREFGWNKTLKEGAAKRLSWTWTDLYFRHAGGGAFVLASALFDDGSTWESPRGSAPCKCLWYNSNKKNGFIRQVDLPFRE